MKKKIAIKQLQVQSFVTDLSKVKGGVTNETEYCGSEEAGCGSNDCSQHPSICFPCQTPMCTFNDECWTDPYNV
ncbi:pinensin family lanthipeptide [Roseivirga sp. BDSF3-8]|uniref:pinensin family lanthipeptide n=1 Tax=Roseivirga sp. BDSF3-8 TaxID=3241598 RepID=UPI003531C30D